MTDATTALLRTLNFVNFHGASIVRIRSRDWNSATFTGVRHEISYRLQGEGAEAAAETFLKGLEEREFGMRGHVLADIALISETRSYEDSGLVILLDLEALTVEME